MISDPKWSHNYLQRAYSSRKSRRSSGLRSSLMYPFTNQKSFKDMSIAIDSDDDKRHLIHISSVSLPRDETHKILASTNGLILSLFFHHPHDDDDNNGSVFSLCVSNPLTKQSVELPDPESASLTNYHDNWLFGIVARRVEQASSSFTYKVVLIRRVLKKDWIDDGHYAKTSTYIFSSDTGSWTAWEQVTCPTDVFSTGEASFSYKAILHWQGYSRSDALITYDPFNSPDEFGQILLPSTKRIIYFRRLPDGNIYHSGCRSMLYLGEKHGLRFCQFTRQNEQLPCSHTLKIWRLMGNDKGEYMRWLPVRGKSVIPSMPYLCKKLLVASDPFDHYVFCHPFVLDNKLTVFSYKTQQTTRKLVDIVLETPKGFWADAYSNPLIPIDFCPWSSPSFYT